MIVTTINVNGVRAAVRERSEDNRGLLAWLARTAAGVVCLQETRADDAQLAEALAPALAEGWHLASAEPHLKGRSGVAILWIEHVVHALLAVIDRLVVLNFGRKIADGSPKDVMQLPEVHQIYIGIEA